MKKMHVKNIAQCWNIINNSSLPLPARTINTIKEEVVHFLFTLACIAQRKHFLWAQ